MKIEIQPALLNEKPVLRNLLELCQYDYGEFDDMDVDEHGLFGYRYLDYYWTEEGRFTFLVRDVEEAEGASTHTIAEYFVMRKYRRRGVGSVSLMNIPMGTSQRSICKQKSGTGRARGLRAGQNHAGMGKNRLAYRLE